MQPGDNGVFEGTVTKVVTKKYNDPTPFVGRYDSNPTEHYVLSLLIELLQANNEKVWFYTPSTRFTVTCGGGIAICILDDSVWFKKTEQSGEHKAYGDSGVPAIQVGDFLRVRGKVKRITDKYGPQLYYVKLLEHQEKGGK